MTLRLNGSTSGYSELSAPAVAGNITLTLPTGTGSANQFLKNGATAGSLGWSSLVETATGVGIGTTGPQRQLDIYDATAPTFALHNATSGTGSSDGFLMFTLGSDVTLVNYENGYMAFSTNATERMKINAAGRLLVPSIYNETTAGAANVNVGSDGFLQRSTSSIKYKTDVEALGNQYADAILDCRPVWYRSTCSNDNPDWGWWGFIAEEVAAIDPRLVHWKTKEESHDDKGAVVVAPCDPEPEGVQYDRFVPHLLNLIKRQQQAIETLEARLTALEVTP